MKKALSLLLLSSFVYLNALDLKITITNLTNAMVFKKMLIIAHEEDVKFFEEGEASSSQLSSMANTGEISSLVNITDERNLDETYKKMVAGETYTTNLFNLAYKDNTNVLFLPKLSILSQLLPTNDGFIALNALDIPTTTGKYTYYLNAYDAGIAANTEVAVHITEATTHAGGTGITGTSAEGFIHIHRGNIGDNDEFGGDTDIDMKIHRWLNPVAKVVIEVSN